MDVLTFVDHLIGHLAWPLAATGLVAFLSVRHRVALDALLYRVRKAKAGPFEAELDEAKAGAEMAGLPPAPTLAPSETEPTEVSPGLTDRLGEWLQYLYALAGTNARKAVLEAYLYLNGYLLKASEYLEPEQVRYTDGSPAIMRLAAGMLLAPQYADVLDRLRDGAISALEDEDISHRQAREYVDLVARLLGAVEQRLRLLLENRSGSE